MDQIDAAYGLAGNSHPQERDDARIAAGIVTEAEVSRVQSKSASHERD